MSIVTWMQSSRVRRGIAASAVILAAGGLILVRAPRSAHGTTTLTSGLTSFTSAITPNGTNASTFTGPGAHGQLALSHGKVLGGAQTIFAEVRLTADSASASEERAPLSIAVVLDTSGSMSGEKIDQAKDSVLKMMRGMRDDDEIAFVRYSSDSEILQPLARLGSVRASIEA